MTTALADFHFAPTELAKENLVKENISEERIWVTGNTSIDALLQIVEEQHKTNEAGQLSKYFKDKMGSGLGSQPETYTRYWT